MASLTRVASQEAHYPPVPTHDLPSSAVQRTSSAAVAAIPLPEMQPSSLTERTWMQKVQEKELAACQRTPPPLIETLDFSKSKCKTLCESAKQLLAKGKGKEAQEMLLAISFEDAAPEVLVLKAAAYECTDNDYAAHFLYSEAKDQLDVEAAFESIIQKILDKGTSIQDYKELKLLAKRYSPIDLFDEERALKGDAAAQALLGYCYMNGYGVAQDSKKALKFYSKAAKAGNPQATNGLGYCYEYGNGVTKDLKKAVELYNKAAELGLPAAIYSLGCCYEDGQGVTKDLKKAKELHSKAAEMGLPEAIYNLGICYQHGHGVTRDSKKAIELHSKAAEMGIGEAIHNLGCCYNDGHGVTKDLKKAIELYINAAQMGMAQSKTSAVDFLKRAMNGDTELEQIFKDHPELARAIIDLKFG